MSDHTRPILVAVLLPLIACTAPNPNASSSNTTTTTNTTTPTTPTTPTMPTPPTTPPTQMVPPPLVPFALDATLVPPSPTNAFADDVNARQLGRALFFDTRLSSDGTIACVSCHDPAHGLSDARVFSVGVGGKLGARHALPINDAVFHPFLFWDGRADSPWSQPLKAIENDNEMAATRVGIAHLVDEDYHDRYQAIFGALPDLSALPANAKPGWPEWDALSPAEQDTAQRIFSNVGKALEAYERQIICADTRFDQWVHGTATLSAEELDGANTFVQRGCIHCHNGPSFSDGQFHNVGIGSGTATPDDGRADAAALLAADVFNGAGAYSDDVAAGQQKLDGMDHELGTLGAFRTASLRGAGQRSPFDQRGSATTLLEFITNTYHHPHLEPDAVGTLDPKLQGVAGGNEAALVAFIGTLDCPSLPANLSAP